MVVKGTLSKVLSLNFKKMFPGSPFMTGIFFQFSYQYSCHGVFIVPSILAVRCLLSGLYSSLQLDHYKFPRMLNEMAQLQC